MKCKKINKKRAGALLVLTAVTAAAGFTAGKAFGADDAADIAKPVLFRFPESLRKDLLRIANQKGQTLTSLMRQILWEYVEGK